MNILSILRRSVSCRGAVVGLALAALLSGCATASRQHQRDEPAQARALAKRMKSDEWVATTLASMSLREKAAQTILVRAYGWHRHPDTPEHRDLVAMVERDGVGGIVLFDSDLESIPRLLETLQSAAKIPLLIAADFESGLAFRVRRGASALPTAMALGATRSTEGARFAGELTGREARAVGVNWVLAPVVDVNNDPANPVINVRSFGEDPELVASLSAAFLEGARSTGVLTTAKHFPGHGDTSVDSHFALPVIDVERERLDAVELAPFRDAIEAGVDSVMTAHLSVPALDPSGVPASMSRSITHDLLRDELGFEGLIATDAMEMKGAGVLWSGGAVVEAIRAGADVVLLPSDTRVAIQSIVRAVDEGRLDEARLDAAVRRILEAKRRVARPGQGLTGKNRWREIARPEDQDRIRELTASAVTLVRNHGEILPLRADRPLSVLHLILKDDPARASQPTAARALARRVVPAATHEVLPQVSPEEIDEIMASAASASHVLVSAYVRRGGQGVAAGLSATQAALLETLVENGHDPILLAFGSPYLLLQAPRVPVYLCAYGSGAAAQEAAIAAVFGESEIRGRLPVSLPGLHPVGDGLEVAAYPMTLALTEPEAAGFLEEASEAVDRVVEDFVRQGAFPGAAVAVGHRGKLAHLAGYGRQSYEAGSPEVTPETIYDLASLTKVIATTTVAMILVDEGRLELDAPVQDFLPLFAGAGKEQVTVRHLLTHSSGVDWWAPLYQEVKGKDAYLDRIQAMPLANEPGTKTVYSDLGLILLGEILERVAGEPLDTFAEKRIFKPLGMHDTRFNPPSELLTRVAPTEEDPQWRGRLVHGEVHDENAFALGGVAPHAGLFSTASDLARFVQMLLNGGVFEHQRIVSRATVAEFTRRSGLPDSTRALGWDTKSPKGSSAGTLFSPNSFGHTGFTGTSIWIDPERELFLVLLTNRVHPTRDNKLIRKARPAIADAVVQGLAPSPPVESGLDRIATGETRLAAAGARLGLIVHAASVTAGGRHAIDVLDSVGAEVVKLFTPEHGLRSRASAGEQIADGRDPISGLPVVSLYGDSRKPSPEDLEGLDALVFDLQGAGVRFYTYVSTMILALEAAAEAGLEFLVLDRPNPLGGLRIEGPVSAPRDEVPESFVNLAPGPLVHGLTLGEMARYVNARLEKPARLRVIPLRGWRRSMTWKDTGRAWIPPSPNLRSAEAALAYPGVALLEGTNVSEGRGTDKPFLKFGAPWLEVGELAALKTPGFQLTSTEFVPVPNPGALRPKYADEECQGFEVTVSDSVNAESYRLGLELVSRLSRQDGFAWRRDGKALTWLLGTPAVYEALAAGRPVDEIVEADATEHERWRADRRSALLY